ncbi:MAG: type II toxin-antitoxin system VapC family toxin [Thermoguttaceae bacterium]
MATGRPIRVYADASVYGGVFDEEFEVASKAFFDAVGNGFFRLVVSTVVRDELKEAPECVVALFRELEQRAEVVDVSDETVELQRAYLAAGIVGAQWRTDALHVALATESQCAAIVSWNFRHIVNFKKIPLYNGVNLAHGYGPIAIHTPQEVIADDR